jgi:hypothetical protein
VRQGASWTAAYHRQLTVAAVARPVPCSVGALGVLAAERSWWLLAQTTSARSSVQPVSSGRAWSPWSTRPAATPRRRSPVSSRRCPPIRLRRPGSGCPAVWCPVTWGRRPESPAVGRLLSARPASGCLLSTRAVSSCPVSARPSGRVRLLPPQAVASGPGRAGRATVTTGTGGGPGGCRAVDGSIDGRGGPGRVRRCPRSRWSVGGRWRTRAAGLGTGRGGRAGPLSDQAGQAGVRSTRRGRRRGGHGSRLQREVAAPAAWLASSGWGATTLGGRRRA